MGTTPRPTWDGRRWRFQFGGKRYTRKREADAWTLLAELTNNEIKTPDVSPIARPAAKTVAGLVVDWLEAHPGSKYRHYIVTDFAEWAGKLSVRQITKDLLERYALWLSKKGKGRRKKSGAAIAKGQPVAIDNAVESIRKKVTEARAVIRWGLDQERYDGLIPVIPRMPKLPKRKRAPRDIPAQQLAKLLEDLRTPKRRRLRQYVEFVAATGCRPGEARLLRWTDIHDGPDGSKYVVLTAHKTKHKTGADREFPLTADALDVLAEVAATQGDGADRTYVFGSSRGEHYTASGLGANLRRLGITAYQLRHTWAQAVLESRQLSDREIATLMGHADTSMVSVYSQVRRAQAAKAASRVASPLRRHDPEPTPPATRKAPVKKRTTKRASPKSQTPTPRRKKRK